MNNDADVEYLYRYRSWDRNVWCAVRQPELSPAQLEAGWGAWEFIDEQKYNEICGYISWERPCHYQAEKLLVTVVGRESFDPAEYVVREKLSIEKGRKEYQERHVSSLTPMQTATIDSYSLLHLAENVARTVGNAISTTATGAVDVATDCVSAIGDSISGMCE